MSDSPREVVDQLQPGTEVELELNDGSKVSGTIDRVEDGEVHLVDEEIQVSADDVGDVIIHVSSEGPE